MSQPLPRISKIRIKYPEPRTHPCPPLSPTIFELLTLILVPEARQVLQKRRTNLRTLKRARRQDLSLLLNELNSLSSRTSRLEPRMKSQCYKRVWNKAFQFTRVWPSQQRRSAQLTKFGMERHKLEVKMLDIPHRSWAVGRSINGGFNLLTSDHH